MKLTRAIIAIILSPILIPLSLGIGTLLIPVIITDFILRKFFKDDEKMSYKDMIILIITAAIFMLYVYRVWIITGNFKDLN